MPNTEKPTKTDFEKTDIKTKEIAKVSGDRQSATTKAKISPMDRSDLAQSAKVSETAERRVATPDDLAGGETGVKGAVDTSPDTANKPVAKEGVVAKEDSEGPITPRSSPVESEDKTVVKETTVQQQKKDLPVKTASETKLKSKTKGMAPMVPDAAKIKKLDSTEPSHMPVKSAKAQTKSSSTDSATIPAQRKQSAVPIAMATEPLVPSANQSAAFQSHDGVAADELTAALNQLACSETEEDSNQRVMSEIFADFGIGEWRSFSNRCETSRVNWGFVQAIFLRWSPVFCKSYTP